MAEKITSTENRATTNNNNHNKKTEPCLFTNQTLAHYLRVSKKWLQRNRNGYHGIIIPYTRAGKKVIYHADDVDAVMAQAMIPAANESKGGC